MSGEARTKSGAVNGTGAAITVECGFTPKRVKLARAVSGTSQCSVEYFDSMPPATGFKITDNGTGSPHSLTAAMLTANGVTINASPSGKFVIGTDADINISGVEIYWFATE